MSETHAFLEYFQGNHVYCAIDDSGVDHTLIHFHEGYDQSREQLIEKLNALNAGTHGIFFCVNEIDRSLDPRKHRTSKMLTRIRAVWADDDGVREQPRMDWPISPNIVVETSKGKFHYYWLTTTDDIEEWGYVMNGIANTYGTDRNAKDLVRVLRVPGFYHKKHEPFQSICYLGSKESYSWEDIVAAFPPDRTAHGRNGDPSGQTHTNATFSSYADARASIITGANFHGAIMWMLNHWVNQGIKDPDELKCLILDILNSSQVQDERWEARTNDDYLSNNIRDALNFVKEHPIHEEIEIQHVERKLHQLDTGFPPGLMGKLCNEIFEMAPHPNEEVALMGGFALVAGIVGRHYNVLGTGLNLYVALLADTGIGKANLKNSINKALLTSCAMEGGIAFKGATRFTGPKSLFQMLSSGLSRVCILEESGLMSASTVGDQSGLTRVMLDIYSSSGKGEFAGGEVYSRTDDDIDVIPSPALTIAHVSTPLSYLRALKSKDATVSGDIARIWLMRSHRDKKNLNLHRRHEFTDQVVKRIKELVKECIRYQQPEAKLEVVDMGTDVVNLQEESDYWTELENKYKREGNDLKRSMTSRAFMKILKIASVASIFNGKTNIGNDEFKWAKEAVEGEIRVIEDSVTFGSSDDMFSVIRNTVFATITKVLNFKYRSPKQCPPKKLQGKGIFTMTNLQQTLKNNEIVKRFDDPPDRPNPKTGVEKVVNYMLRAHFIVQLSEDQLRAEGVRARLAYKITDEFALLAEEE